MKKNESEFERRGGKNFLRLIENGVCMKLEGGRRGLYIKPTPCGILIFYPFFFSDFSLFVFFLIKLLILFYMTSLTSQLLCLLVQNL